MQYNRSFFRTTAILLAGFFFTWFDAVAQRAVPQEYAAGTMINYVKTWDATAPDPDGNYITQRPLKDVKLTTQYIDGLARPFQTVVRKGSLETGPGILPKDMVVMQQYDGLGREAFKYLPYAETNSNDGTFKTDPFTKQAAFMNATYGTGIQNETWYYAQTDFEASPLNRPGKQMAAGNSWAGAARGVVMKYWNNTLTDAVKKWEINTATNQLPTFPVGTPSGSYNAGELIKTITADEHGKQVIEFKDKDGKVILKKVQITATADDGTGRDYTGWLCTYYLYDIYDNLRCVVQPKGVELLNDNSWNLNALSGTILAEQCFQYGYDSRNRLTVKKVPGAGYIDMIYDARDRLIITQDAKMRAAATPQWLYTQYDQLNRPVATGMYAYATTANFYRDYAANLSDFPWNHWGAIVPEILTITHYDDYTGLPSGLSSFLTTWNTHFDATDNTSWPYPQLVTAASTATKGMVTWTQTKILGTSTFLNAVSYYDEKGRVIQVQSTNITGGTDVVTTQYSWAGQPLVSVQKQTHATSSKTIVIVSKNSYDDLGRLVKTEKKQSHTDVASGAMSAYTTIAELKYDKLGQLKEKKLAPAYNSGGGLETLTYDYNIRGWMLGANRAYARDDNNDHYFGFDLGYDKMSNNLINGQTYNAAQYNGNITGTVWKSKGDGEKRKYDFSYDAANRFLKGDFSQYAGSVFSTATTVNYTVKMGTFDPLTGASNNDAYDANGNIKRMQQWGLKLNSSSQVDNLGYQYMSNSNKLLSVTEATLGTTDNKLGDFTDKNTSNDDYSYDVNGNLTLDNNKSISSIAYNHLNLPSVITVTGKGTITYTYDAAGNKLRKTTVETNVSIAPYNGTTVTSTTEYIGGFIYESKHYSTLVVNNDLGYTNKLQFTGHEEGRIRPTYTEGATADAYVLNGFVYDYMIKDHLGNVRMVLTEEVKQVTYPAATLEDATVNGRTAVSKESEFYTIDATKIVANPAGSDTYPNNNGNPPYNNNYHSNTGVPTSKVYKTKASENKIGLGIVLKVMAGDAINIYGKSYHKKPTGADYTNPVSLLSLADVINSFTGTGLMIDKSITGTTITGAPGFPASIPALLGTQPGQTSDLPRASINWIVFDEQFKYQDGGFDMADEASGSVKSHTITTIPTIEIPKNGYIYVYVSNESNYDVFFDNLQLIHTQGPILEETHYYPFGLTMAGISSKAAGNLENRKLFNGKEEQCKEFRDGSGLDWYDYGARMYDKQVGRWMVIDPKTEMLYGWSSYVYCNNDPIFYVDKDGKFLGTLIGGAIGAIVGGVKAAVKGENVWRGIGKGAISGAIAGAVVDLTVATAGTGTVALVAAGALSGATGSIVDQALDGKKINWGQVGVSGALGGGLGYLGAKVAPMLAGTRVGGWLGMNSSRAASIEVGATESIALGRNSLVGIETSYGVANQSTSTAAARAAYEVEQGATMYRVGTLGQSHAAEGQFWSLENPANYLNDLKKFASKFGIPEENLSSGSIFIESGKLKQTGFFITREAPGVGASGGGAVEVVVRPGDVQLSSFNVMGGK